MQGLILAGGRGSRLAADGVEAPKPLVEVGGRPQIVNLIETFAELGCESITCMVRDGITLDVPAPTIVRSCRTPSSLHTLVAGLALVPSGPVFCAMVDTVMPQADWRRLYRGVTERLTAGSLAVLAVTPFVDDELPLYVTRNAEGLATGIFDTPPPGPLLVTGGVYGGVGISQVPVADGRDWLHRMRAFLRLLVELRVPVSTVEVPRIIDLDHKRDLEAAERWLTAPAGDEQ